MAPLSADYMALLETALTRDFVPNLPPLQDQTKPADQQAKKNLSRAFSAFALHKLCEISPKDAAAAVVDDFDDFGIDAIYYQGSSETLFLVQGKLKASETFSQDEANAFCQGARRLIKQDFTGFNGHVTNRQAEIEGALEACSHSHPARIQIIETLLRRQTCIGCDLVEEIGLAASTTSEHLRILKEAGLITGEIVRPRVCYALAPEAVGPLIAFLERIQSSSAQIEA